MDGINGLNEYELMSDELLDFDFSEYFGSEWSTPDTACSPVSSKESEASSVNDEELVKSSCSNKSGSKFHSTKKALERHRQQRQYVKESAAISMQRKKPLYVFPSFDKCDSLLFFPSALARHLNSDDMQATAKLLYRHLDKDCQIRIDICPDQLLNLKQMLTVTEILNAMQPDRVLCVHSTRVIENQIHASIYFKSTESVAIIDGVARSTKDPLFHTLCPTSRNERLKARIQERGSASVEEENQLCNLIDSNVDLLAYVHLDMIVTFDDLTKKITALELGGVLTSLHAVTASQ